MAIRLVGELLSPISCPMAGVTIHLKALDTSASVLFSSEASVKTDYKGRYEFTVPTGLYLVSLDNGISSAELGQIQVYSDSTESTLQALLDAPQTEPSPIWLQQLEEKVAEATRQAGIATNAATEATTAAKTVKDNVDAAKQHADRAYASATNAAKSEASASADSVSAEESAVRAEEAAAISQSLGVVNPNLFINGDFSVDQRGKNQRWVGDRWQYFTYVASNSIDCITVDLRSAESDRKVASHAAHMTKDASTTYDNISLSQKIECATSMIGRFITVSGTLRVRANNTWHGVDTLRDYFDRCELRFGPEYDTRLSILPSQWEFTANKFDSRYIHFSVTFPPLNSTSAVSYAEVLFWCSKVNQDWTLISFTNMKCERSSVATPFVPDAQAVNMMKCERYLQKFYARGNIGTYSASHGFLPTVLFRTEMRSTPSVSVTDFEFKPRGDAQWEAEGKVVINSCDSHGFSAVFARGSNSSNAFTVGIAGYGAVLGYADAEI